MKEYWVNVYEKDWGRCWEDKNECIRRGNNTHMTFQGPLKYRLHVREFKTKEAKELYQSLIGSKFNHRFTFKKDMKGHCYFEKKYDHNDYLNDIQDIYA